MKIWVVRWREYDEIWGAYKSKEAAEWYIQKHFNETLDEWEILETELKDA